MPHSISRPLSIVSGSLCLALATVLFLLGDREMGWVPLSVISGWLPNFVLAGLLFFAGLALVWLTCRGSQRHAEADRGPNHMQVQPKTEASEQYLAMLSRLRESSELERVDDVRAQIPVETLTH